MSGKNYLEMSDEDFLALPEHATGKVAEEVTPDENAPEPEKPQLETEVVTEPEQKPVEEPVKEEEQEPSDEEILDKEKQAEKPVEPDPKAENEPEKELTEEEKKAAEEAAKEPDYKEFYTQVIGPLKANGKTIDIKNIDDVKRLMQMGAGFGRKMQDIQPHLKTLRFLEANNLLNADQADLAFLVDLKNKNPDAIKKLVKESGIDPLDFNTEEPVNYRTNIPPVTDQEIVFREALDNLAMQDQGLDTIKVCNETWDAQSHQALMNDPALLGVIHEHRQMGIYDRIVGEMDRQKALGNIPHSTPFIAAYKQVGDHLRDTNGFADLIEKQRTAAPVNPVAEQPKQPQLIDTRVAAPKPSVSNNAQAKAAASTKITPKKAAPIINPLEMSDEEFAKAYGNRY